MARNSDVSTPVDTVPLLIHVSTFVSPFVNLLTSPLIMYSKFV